MSQAKEDHTGTASVVSDYDAISRVLQLCTEGEAKGDVAKLREAFHKDARMFGSLAGERYDVPIEELFALAESEPADTGDYRSRVLSVQQTGMPRSAWWRRRTTGGRSPSSTTSCWRVSRAPGRSCVSCSPTPVGSRPRESKSNVSRVGASRAAPALPLLFLAVYSPECVEKLSEKGRRSLECSLTEHLNGAFRPVLASLYLPNPR